MFGSMSFWLALVVALGVVYYIFGIMYLGWRQWDWMRRGPVNERKPDGSQKPDA